MSFDFFPNEEGAAMLQASRHPSTTSEAGTWDNFASGAANFGMRSMAEAGRAVSLLGGAAAVAADALVGQDNYSGKLLADQYFEKHDAVFQNAVDYWTPRPGEVGTAGQITGQLVGGALQAVVSPALLVGTATASPGLELVRDGVDSTTAGEVAAVQGATMAAGVALPFLGNTLVSRVLSGVAGNVAQGAAGDAASRAVLKAADYGQQAERFDPFNTQGRVLDAALGAAFGALAHVRAPRAAGVPEPVKLTPTEQAALLVANQVHHLESAGPGRPVTDVDTVAHTEAMRQAIDQTLRGEPVTVDHLTQDMRMVPDPALNAQRAEVGAEAQRLAELEAPTHEPVPDVRADTQPAMPEPAGAEPHSVRAWQVAQDRPDLLLATDRVDAEGRPVTVTAREALALAEADHTFARSRAPDVFMTVAHCLLGAI